MNLMEDGHSMAEPVRVGIIGMGGFAESHHRAVHTLEGQGSCRLVTGCDPHPESFGQLVAELAFETRGIRVYDDYIQMLEQERGALEVVTIPAPLPLHAEMHAACVARGLAVYLEKPPTLDYTELERMIAIDQAASTLTAVGFNYIVQPARRALKERILSGEFGAVRRVCFSGLWPRPPSYYERTFWAGKLVHDGRLVLDSCMGNAMAHHVHNVLHWAGQGSLDTWAGVADVSAELYRAHAIESFDTAFVKAATSDGVELRLALSHACDGESRHSEWIICDDATVVCDARSPWRIDHRDGRREHVEVNADDLLAANLMAYFSYVRREVERPLTSLADSRPFVELCDLAFIAAGRIHQVPEAALARAADREDAYIAISDLGDVLDRYFADDLFPSEQEVVWGEEGGRATPEDLLRLPDTVATMMR